MSWHIEFSKVIGCSICDRLTDPNILRDIGENVPQPGYIGAEYGKFRILLVGQNPGMPQPWQQEKDRTYTEALRALRDARTPEVYRDLQLILDNVVPDWPIHKKYFPLEESGLTLRNIAYCNLVRCRTMHNLAPNARAAGNCKKMHFEPWLDLLKPAAVVFIGFWARDHGADACKLRGIPYRAVNRDRNQTRTYGNRDEVVGFVKEHIGSVDQNEGSVPIFRNDPHTTQAGAINPKRTLEILIKLERLGLTDKVFWKIHHRTREPISRFRAYCENGPSEFQLGGTNERVHQRLEFILKNYRSKGSHLADAQELVALAEAALKAIPMK